RAGLRQRLDQQPPRGCAGPSDRRREPIGLREGGRTARHRGVHPRQADRHQSDLAPLRRSFMTAVAGTNPRTAEPLPSVAEESSPSDVDAIASAAARSATAFADLGRAGRAQFLEAIAETVDARRSDLVDVAATETGFTTAKLDGELTRTVFQFRFFADVI